MRRILRLGVLLLLGVPAITAAADLGVITGGAHGTYHRFGQDLRRLVKPSGLDLTVHPSRGAVENLAAVSERPDVQLGIVQSDVLLFVADQRAHPVLGRLTERIEMVFPLYDEQVHVLARRDISSFEQLAGKRVAVGSEGSGTHLTARWLFKLAEIAPAAVLPIEPAQALAQLKAGQIDALVYVAAAPIGLLQHMVRAEDGLALVPIEDKSIVDAYETAVIPADAYDWQPGGVPTVTVKAVLVSSAARAPDCEAVGRLAQQVAAGMPWLTQHGHPRWQQVDLDAPVRGWKQSECVRRYVGKAATGGDDPAASTGERNPVFDAMKDALDRR